MKRRAYLLIYSDGVGTREQLQNYIDSLPEILNWRFDLPHMFYLISEHDADEITERIRQFTMGDGRFLIAEVGENKQGWLSRGTWRFLNEKPLPKGSSSPPAEVRAAERRASE